MITYNGYNLNGTAIYNPLSVVEAVANNDFDQHWTETGTYGDIRELINMNMDGVLDSSSMDINTSCEYPANFVKRSGYPYAA